MKYILSLEQDSKVAIEIVLLYWDASAPWDWRVTTPIMHQFDLDKYVVTEWSNQDKKGM